MYIKKDLSILLFYYFGILIITSCSDRSGPAEGPPGDRKWKMVWNDEFEGASYDTTRWFPSGGGWTLPDFKTLHTDENLIMDGKSNLIIRVSKNDQGTLLYNNGLTSYYEKAYGYFEARVKFSTQPGWWTAFWLSGHPYFEGDDCFVYPQEFDVYEDFYKPKKENDLQHVYHANAGLPGEYGKTDMMNCNKVRRHSVKKRFTIDKYEGWHTVAVEWTPLEHIFYFDGKENFRMNYRKCPVTNVPQKIWVSGCYRTPSDSAEAFYGLAKYGKWPDQVVFDYVRVYDQDWGKKTAPSVEVVTLLPKSGFSAGEPVQFLVNANDDDGIIKTIYLFSKGRIRAEIEVDSVKVNHTFTLWNLFTGENTIIAMAKDNDGRVGQSGMIRVNISE